MMTLVLGLYIARSGQPSNQQPLDLPQEPFTDMRIVFRRGLRHSNFNGNIASEYFSLFLAAIFPAALKSHVTLLPPLTECFE